MCEGEGRRQLLAVEPSLGKEEAAGPDHRIPVCPLLKHQQCLGDKVTLPAGKPCPVNIPPFLWGIWGHGGALGQGSRLCSGQEFFQQQCLLVGGCCSLHPLVLVPGSLALPALLLSKQPRSEERDGS